MDPPLSLQGSWGDNQSVAPSVTGCTVVVAFAPTRLTSYCVIHFMRLSFCLCSVTMTMTLFLFCCYSHFDLFLKQEEVCTERDWYLYIYICGCCSFRDSLSWERKLRNYSRVLFLVETILFKEFQITLAILNSFNKRVSAYSFEAWFPWY